MDDLGAVETESRNGACVARLSGEIDLDNAAPIFATVRAGADGASVLVLDVLGVTFLGSRGLAEIAGLVRDQPTAGWLRIVARPDGPVTRVLDIGGFRDAVLTFDSVDDALAATTEG
jgi:anti-anti-sigma factor